MADLVWSDPDAEKEDFAISPRSVHNLTVPRLMKLIPSFPYHLVSIVSISETNHIEVQATHLGQASCISSWKRTTCRIFYARTNSVWKGIHRSLTNTFPLSGQRPTIVIVVATPRAYLRSVLARACISMCSMLPRRTNAMVQVNKLLKMLVGRYVTVHAFASCDHFTWNRPNTHTNVCST